jgi:hypothetical protein
MGNPKRDAAVISAAPDQPFFLKFLAFIEVFDNSDLTAFDRFGNFTNQDMVIITPFHKMRKQNRLNIVYTEFSGNIVKMDFPLVLAFVNTVFLGKVNNLFEMIHYIQVFERYMVRGFRLEREKFVFDSGKIHSHIISFFCRASFFENPTETITIPFLVYPYCGVLELCRNNSILG